MSLQVQYDTITKLLEGNPYLTPGASHGQKVLNLATMVWASFQQRLSGALVLVHRSTMGEARDADWGEARGLRRDLMARAQHSDPDKYMRLADDRLCLKVTVWVPTVIWFTALLPDQSSKSFSAVEVSRVAWGIVRAGSLTREGARLRGEQEARLREPTAAFDVQTIQLSKAKIRGISGCLRPTAEAVLGVIERAARRAGPNADVLVDLMG